MKATIPNLLGNKSDGILTLPEYDQKLIDMANDMSRFSTRLLIQITPWVASSHKQDSPAEHGLLECLPPTVRLPESLPIPQYRVISGRLHLVLDHSGKRSRFAQACIRIASWFLSLGCGALIKANVLALAQSGGGKTKSEGKTREER